ncbi:MAG: hypothetical protein ACRD2A_03710 [Vicinamibacterales bacterium]
MPDWFGQLLNGRFVVDADDGEHRVRAPPHRGPHAFDHLLSEAFVKIKGPIDVRAFKPAPPIEDEEQEVEGALAVEGLRWEPPALTFRVNMELEDPANVEVLVGVQSVKCRIALTPKQGETLLVATIKDNDVIAMLDSVVGVEIRVRRSSAVLASPILVPYHLVQLRQQERRRLDTDRLRCAAELELDDPDLQRALEALEEIMFGEGHVRWTAGDGGEPREGEDGDDGPALRWEDIDWDAVRRHPRYRDYGGGRGIGAVAGTDLAIYLQALGSSIRELVVDETEPSSQGTDEGDDGPTGSGTEGTSIDDLDEGPEDDDETVRRRTSAARRNLRLIRKIVRRNLRALEQPRFRVAVGPGVVIPNVLILGWICWWTASKQSESATELISERIRLWRLLWGTRKLPAGT